MSGMYNFASKYLVTALCDSPLRTGSAGGGADEILRDEHGNPFIQGASLAGAMREWVRSSPFSDLEVNLFGCGRVVISDGIFCSDGKGVIQTSLRPRLKINGRTGSAANGAKFSVSAVPAGCRFNFTITMLEEIKDDRMQQAIEQMLSAMNAGFITLGAQKTNGYGRVLLSVRKRSYELSNSSDMEAWLDDADDAEEFILPECETSGRVVFRVSGAFPNVLVRSENPRVEGSSKVTVNISENGKILIPGSSIKGAVRSRVKAIADVLKQGSGEDTVNEIFGTGTGDTGIPGKVYFSDAVLEDSKAATIRRIKINKFTGGVFRNALFSEETQCGRAEFIVSAPRDEFICGMIFFALRDLCAGTYSLGSGSNIGRGYISGGEIHISVPENSGIDISFSSSGKCTSTDPDNVIGSWIKSLGGDSDA